MAFLTGDRKAMSWNGSDNNHHSEQDPWAKPGQSNDKGARPDRNDERSQQDPSHKPEQGPPDLEEVFNNLLGKLGGKNSRSPHNSGGSFGSLTKIFPIIAVIAVIVWAISGFYTIKEAERGVVLRFGKTHTIVQPGLNWKPTFIDKVIPVNIERISELRTQGSMLTQDENMVVVELTVQYRVNDPEKYLFHVTNPNDSLSQATDSALRYIIGHMNMDDILTTGRSVVREDTWRNLENIIKPYNMGIEVIDVNFQSARPPEQVKDAFDDAIKAQEDEQRFIRNAEAYAREVEPIARGNAQRIIEQATAYREQVVLDAQGEVERYKLLLPAYKAAPELQRERIYIQTMEDIMGKTPKVMLDNSAGNSLNVLPLEQLLKLQQDIPQESSDSTTSSGAKTQSAVDAQKRSGNTDTFNQNSIRNQSGLDNYTGSQYEQPLNSNRQGRFE